MLAVSAFGASKQARAPPEFAGQSASMPVFFLLRDHPSILGSFDGWSSTSIPAGALVDPELAQNLTPDNQIPHAEAFFFEARDPPCQYVVLGV